MSTTTTTVVTPDSTTTTTTTIATGLQSPRQNRRSSQAAPPAEPRAHQSPKTSTRAQGYRTQSTPQPASMGSPPAIHRAQSAVPPPAARPARPIPMNVPYARPVYSVPSPDALPRPPSNYGDVKTYVVIVGQDVGIFFTWYVH